jgi:hypothetical protein
MSRPNRRRRTRIVNLIDEIVICGVNLRRITLPNGKRAFEEEGVRALLLETMQLPSAAEIEAFDVLTQPEARH